MKLIITAISMILLLFPTFVDAQARLEPDSYKIYKLEESGVVTRIKVRGLVNCKIRLPEGLSLGQVTAVNYRSGSSGTVRKKVGKTVQPMIMIEVAWENAKHFIKWFKEVKQGKQSRKRVSIILQNVRARQKSTFNLINCWPAEVMLQPFDTNYPPVIIALQCEAVTW